MTHRTAPLASFVVASLLLAAAPAARATTAGHNGLIAFHSQTPAGAQIFTVRPDGRGLRQITHVAGDAAAADWSPDGRRIAFDIGSEEGATVAIMNSDGSGLETVQGLGLFNFDASFTPDGRRLVYTFFNEEHGGVASMRLDGTDQRVLLANDNVEDANVSPDGRRISLTCIDVPLVLHALCTMPAAGGSPTPITPFTINVGAKSDWAPDGRELVFTDHADLPNPGDSANVGVVRPDGTRRHLLTNFSGGETNAFAGSYSPDGRQVVFRLEDHGRFGLYRMRRDGSHVRAILPLSDFAPRFIDWGPRPKRHR